MQQELILKIILAFLVSGIWITFSTLFAERFGSKLGGLMANMPSNILVTLIFIALLQGKEYAAKTTLAVPIGMTLCSIFLLVFVIMLQYNLMIAVGTSVIVWIISALLLNKLSYSNIIGGTIIYIIVTALCFVILEYIIKIPSAEKKKKNYTTLQIIMRALFAGSLVATVITFSTFSTSYFTGLLTTFPSVILSTMIILSINQGNKFTQGLGKVMLLGSSNILVYTTMIYFTFPTVGIWIGTIVSLAASIVWLLIMRPFIEKIS